MRSEKRFLNCYYAIEVLHGRLNCSSKEVEDNKKHYDNATYVKKINGRGTVSAQSQKYNIQQFMSEQGFELATRVKSAKKAVITQADPFKYINEDLLGFMRAEMEELTKEQYKELPEERQELYSQKNNKYTLNITKKRKSRFLMSPLVNISNDKAQFEWNTCSTTTDALPYQVEVYSGVFVGMSNVNINDISSFKISDIESEFRDYSKEEGLTEKDIEITAEEKYNRIEVAIRGLQHLAFQGCQTNYLVDTKPKFIILSEYSWGNNAFYGVLKENGLDIDALIESIEENECFRKSPIWIGVSSKIQDKNYKNLKEKLKKDLAAFDYIKIGSPANAFDGYLEYLKETLK